jgi:hypothetical protein
MMVNGFRLDGRFSQEDSENQEDAVKEDETVKLKV